MSDRIFLGIIFILLVFFTTVSFLAAIFPRTYTRFRERVTGYFIPSYRETEITMGSRIAAALITVGELWVVYAIIRMVLERRH